jgi:hypothetical protein
MGKTVGCVIPNSGSPPLFCIDFKLNDELNNSSVGKTVLHSKASVGVKLAFVFDLSQGVFFPSENRIHVGQ